MTPRHNIVKYVRSINPNDKNTNSCELEAMCNNSRNLNNSCLLALTDTWLTDKISDNCASLPGFGILCRGQIETVTTLTRQEVGVFVCMSMKAGVRKRR